MAAQPDGTLDRRPPRAEALIAPVRRFGVRSFLFAVSATGLVAGVLSASGRTERLWVYVVLAAAAFVLTLVAFVLSTPRYRFALFSFVYPRPLPRTEAGHPYHLHLHGTGPQAPVLQIAAGRAVDHVYEGGLRSLLDAESPVAIVASSPRDIEKGHRLPIGMFAKEGARTECFVDPEPFGVPLRCYRFERQFTEGTQDTDHMLGIKDIVFLPHLAAVLRPDGADGEPFVWPEHCVDVPFLATHDVVVVGAGDSNFWHGALFEPLVESFSSPASTVPLALDLRDGSGELSYYSSRVINLALAGRETIPGLEGAHRFELDERRFPTCAAILACENPFAQAAGRSHWCAFVAGTRSLGTSGAVLALSAMLRHMRADPDVNYRSRVETADRRVTAHVSAILCRTVEVEYAASLYGDEVSERGRRTIPADRPDPRYDSSYVPTAVEYFDNSRDRAEWKPLVSLGPRAARPTPAPQPLGARERPARAARR